MSTNTLPPHDDGAERAVLAESLIAWDDDRKAAELLEVWETLAPEDFFTARHQHIARAVLAVLRVSATVDIVSVATQLRSKGFLDAVGGAPYLAELANDTPAVASVRKQAASVRETAQLRRIAQLLATLAVEARGPIENVSAWLEDAQERVFREAAPSSAASRGRMYRDVLAGSIDKASAARSEPEKHGVPTGLTPLDRLTNGFRRGKLWVVAGRSGMGKTALVGNIAENVAARGHGVVFFSGEMEDVELGDRGLSRSMDVPAKRIDSGGLSPEEWSELTRAVQEKSAYPLLIDDSTPIAPSELSLAARRHAATLRVHGAELRLIVVDYLQLYRSGRRNGTRTEELGELTGALKRLAKEMRVAVVALSQLNRDGKDGRPPILTDLKDSSSIEQDADVILFVHRADYFKDSEQAKDHRAQLIVAKGRGVGTGTVEVCWAPQRTEFFDVADRYTSDGDWGTSI